MLGGGTGRLCFIFAFEGEQEGKGGDGSGGARKVRLGRSEAMSNFGHAFRACHGVGMRLADQLEQHHSCVCNE